MFLINYLIYLSITHTHTFIYIYNHHVVLQAQITLILLLSLSITLSFFLSPSLFLSLTLSLLPSASIIHYFREVFYTISCILTELLYISSCWSSVWRGPSENVASESVLTSPAGSCMSCSSYLDGFKDGRLVAIQLLFCGMLLRGFDVLFLSIYLSIYLSQSVSL